MKSLIECSICLNIFNKPVDCSSCFGTLCQKCRLPNDKNEDAIVSCPLCRAYSTCVPSRKTSNFLDLLKFKCKNAEYGCTVESVHSELPIHEECCEHMGKDDMRKVMCKFKSELQESKREIKILKRRIDELNSENNELKDDNYQLKEEIEKFKRQRLNTGSVARIGKFVSLNDNIEDKQYSKLIEIFKHIDDNVTELNKNNLDYLSNQEFNKLIEQYNQFYHPKFSKYSDILKKKSIEKILNQLNDDFESKINLNKDEANQMQDYKLQVNRNDMVKLIGENEWKKLEYKFNKPNYKIILRRVSVKDKIIPFHFDEAIGSLQLCLNNPEEYEGARLVYIDSDKIVVPKRNKGNVTIHDNKTIHGVSPLKNGVRCSLFMLQDDDKRDNLYNQQDENRDA